jgi:hypothetical protein
MQFYDSVISGAFSTRRSKALAWTLWGLLAWTGTIEADMLTVPNGSFESPVAPREAPYASPEIDEWQKSAQPVGYDPSTNGPWAYQMGEFFNVPFPGQFIDNCDGAQAAFVFAWPDAGLFQDYDSIFGMNTTPSHAFNAEFKTGHAYDLTVGVIGGGGGMNEGATLQLSLYYRDAFSDQVIVASTGITNSTGLFPTNTHFVDFRVHVPWVKPTDTWAGRHIGIQLLSTTALDLRGGYWDVDNVRLSETVPAPLTLSVAGITNYQFNLTVLGEPGLPFELQATTNLPAVSNDWAGIGVFENLTGLTIVPESVTNDIHRYFRARQLW